MNLFSIFKRLFSSLNFQNLFPSHKSLNRPLGEITNHYSQRGLAPLVIIVAVALIAAAVPTTVILVQQEQDNRQLAANPTSERCSCDFGETCWTQGKNCETESAPYCIEGACHKTKNPKGEKCGEDEDCITNICVKGTCYDGSKGDLCEATGDCNPYLSCNFTTSDDTCQDPLPYQQTTCLKKCKTITGCVSSGSSDILCNITNGGPGAWCGMPAESIFDSAIIPNDSACSSKNCGDDFKCIGGAPTTPTPVIDGSKPRCNEYELTNLSGQYYGECKSNCDGSINESPLLSHTCDYTEISSVCCKVKILSDAKKPTPIVASPTTSPPVGGGGAQPTPTPIPPTTKGFCADGNRQYDKPVNTPSCVINSTVYRQQFDSYCHDTYGSPSDFFYECLAANAPTTASGYCSNSTKTSTGVPINNGCGVWSNVKDQLNWDTNYDDYCKENYGSKDSQSNYFYKCPATTPTPPPTTITPQPGAGGSGGTCQPGNPVETCSCPGTGNCSASTGGPAYTNWGCFTTSFDSQARCCPNDRRYACADGTCKANLAACTTSSPTATPTIKPVTSNPTGPLCATASTPTSPCTNSSGQPGQWQWDGQDSGQSGCIINPNTYKYNCI